MSFGTNPVSNEGINNNTPFLNKENQVEKKIDELAQPHIQQNGEKKEPTSLDKPVEDLSKKGETSAPEQTAKKVDWCDCIKKFFGFSK